MQSSTSDTAYSHPALLLAIQQLQPDYDAAVQLMQRAGWNRSLSAELSGLILGKSSRYNVKMVAVSECVVSTAARHSQRSGSDQVRDFAMVTSADHSWLGSHSVRE